MTSAGQVQSQNFIRSQLAVLPSVFLSFTAKEDIKKLQPHVLLLVARATWGTNFSAYSNARMSALQLLCTRFVAHLARSTLLRTLLVALDVRTLTLALLLESGHKTRC